MRSHRKQCPRGASSKLSAKQCHLRPGTGRGTRWPLDGDNQQVVGGSDGQCVHVCACGYDSV